LCDASVGVGILSHRFILTFQTGGQLLFSLLLACEHRHPAYYNFDRGLFQKEKTPYAIHSPMKTFSGGGALPAIIDFFDRLPGVTGFAE
jgi:hypothetical protein